MRNVRHMVAVIVIVAAAGVVVAHHAAQGIVDDDVYAMIDAIVEDTPHGDMTLNDLGSGMTEILITNVTIREVENLIADGLLTYGGMLDGQVAAEISLASMRDVEVRILQQE